MKDEFDMTQPKCDYSTSFGYEPAFLILKTGIQFKIIL